MPGSALARIKKYGFLLLVIGTFGIFGSSPIWAHGGHTHDHDHHENSIPSVLILANSPSEPAKLDKLKQLAEFRGFKAETQFISGQDPEELGERLQQFDLIVIDYVYEGAFTAIISAYEPYLQKHPGVVFAGLYFYRKDLARGLTKLQSKTLFDYYGSGGEKNFSNFFQYVKHTVLGKSDVAAEAPVILPETGIYHPDAKEVFTSLDDFMAWKKPDPMQPVVGVGFMRKSLEEELLVPVDTLVRRLEAEGVIVVPYFHPTDQSSAKVLYLSGDNEAVAQKPSYRSGAKLEGVDAKTAATKGTKQRGTSWQSQNGNPNLSAGKPSRTARPKGEVGVDLLVTFRGVMNAPSLRQSELLAMNVVMIDAMIDGTQTYQEWKEDEQGWPMFRMGPWWTNAELAGYIDPTVVGVVGDDKNETPTVIPEQMDALVERIQNYLKLKQMPNAEKEVAIFVWNSPDGEDNFSASYLNVPKSLIDTFTAMREAGYQVDDIDEEALIAKMKLMIKPYYRVKDEIALRQLLAEDLATKVKFEDYQIWYQTLPEEIRVDMDENWPEEIANNYLTITEGEQVYYVIPRLKLGNIQILPQPLRGGRRDMESDIMHDKKHPVHYAYRAVYHQITQHDPVDAIVHYGTHGSQEWLSGKERGQWVGDDTQTTIGNLPVVYPYNVANSGEGLIAKRRGRAVVISHNSPPFAPAGLYGDLVKVHEIMHQLENMEEGRVYENTQKHLVEVVKELGFNKDLEFTDEQIWGDWTGFIDALHGYMEGIASAAQPLGMHTFGSTAEPEHIMLTIMQILGPDYMVAADPVNGLHAFSQNYETLMEGLAYKTLKAFLMEGKPLEVFDQKTQPFLVDAKKHWDNFYAEKEMEHLLKALNVGFIPTGTGNDPLRNPEAVPTGKNTYAFDPTKIPTKAAWEAGVELAQSLIDNYREENSVYPDKLTFSMWSTETIKHFGVIEAEVLFLLGVKPVWNERDQVVGVEVIPAAELGRPRIDTVLSLTGLYRDNLPEVMLMLQDAISQVAALKEPNNYVYENSQKMATSLIEKGLTAEEAAAYAQVRLFGAQSGVYGTHLPEATLASDTWEEESSLAEMYLSRMGYMYGNDEITRSAKLEVADLFAENLKGTDAAILSRSSNNHGILSLDHPFEYLGGISLAVKHLDGKNPEMFIADLRNTRNFANETVPKFLSKELRARYYHPRWITEMKAEGYSGTTEMLDMINNFWGWNVMDRNAVREDQWQELFEVYVQDKLDLELREYFEQQNPAALAQISERMLEAVRKEYWDAPEETVKALLETYFDLVSEHDIDTMNEKFKDFAAETAKGYGIALPQYKSEAVAEAFKQASQNAQAPETEMVEGRVLEKQEQKQPEEQEVMWWLLLFVGIGLAGFIFEWMRSSREARA